MAARKNTKDESAPEPTEPADTKDEKPAVVQSFPAALVPGSNFASRYKARMNARG